MSQSTNKYLKRHKSITVDVLSAGFNAGDIAEITVMDVLVIVEKNEHNHYRGLHIVVINPTNGKVETAKVFDTYKKADGFDSFITKHIPEGHIVVAACKDECTTSLSQSGKQWFANMGSKEIWNLGYRCAFAFVGVSGRKDPSESRAEEKWQKVAVTYDFDLVDDTPPPQVPKEIPYPLRVNQPKGAAEPVPDSASKASDGPGKPKAATGEEAKVPAAAADLTREKAAPTKAPVAAAAPSSPQK